MKGERWTREQTIVALYLFCTIPFNKCQAKHPTITHMANLIGKTPAAMNMKIGNFGRLDPTLAARGITGLKNGSKLEEIIWKEFDGRFDELANVSQQILESLNAAPVIRTDDLPAGTTREVIVKQRINQDFFRRVVISSYNNRCCITGIAIPELLEACHISDWASDEKNRTNPHNGLSLTPTLHQAYDKMLIAISPDYKVIVSQKIMDDSKMKDETRRFFTDLNNSTIIMPDRFAPSKDLLDINFQKFLRS